MFNWTLLIVYAGLIFVGSSLSSRELPSDLRQADKLIHAVEFGAFAFLYYRALRGSLPLFPTRFLLGAVLAGSLIYAGLDEVHQAYVPTRQADPNDLLADALGIIAALWVIYRRWEKK